MSSQDIDRKNRRIRLISTGWVNALPAGELEPGMHRLYNYGGVCVVKRIRNLNPLSKGWVIITVADEDTGSTYTERKRPETLVAVRETVEQSPVDLSCLAPDCENKGKRIYHLRAMVGRAFVTMKIPACNFEHANAGQEQYITARIGEGKPVLVSIEGVKEIEGMEWARPTQPDEEATLDDRLRGEDFTGIMVLPSAPVTAKLKALNMSRVHSLIK